LFGEPLMGPDETSFQVQNTDAAYYDSPYYKLHQSQLQAIPTPPPAGPLDLGAVISAEALASIAAAKKIVFHAVGDTGASMAIRIATEADVADAMTADLKATAGEAPSFLFHLGDVIYNFGEAQYYYDQFYEPFRGYNRPIFAIPGNHDGEVQYGSDPATPLTPTLLAFLRNFCAAQPAASPDSGGLVRSTMTQPGAYFTLDAPFVSIIGLYSNVLETFGVISSQGGRYAPPLDDDQLDWLISELKRLKGPRESLERCRAARLPSSAGLGRPRARRWCRPRPRHRRCLRPGRPVAGRRPFRTRPPLSTFHPQERAARDPLHRRRQRRTRSRPSPRRGSREDSAHLGGLHPRPRPDPPIRVSHHHRRHDQPNRPHTRRQLPRTGRPQRR
jgi:Calcineurin-like phosphoesterase